MRRRFLTNFLLILAILAVVGGSAAVIAYMFRETQVETNELIPAKVACSVAEEFNGTTKSSITVKNDGNIDAYIRVRLVTYWVNEDGNVAPKSSEDIPDFTLGANWIAGGNNTYYYIAQVPPGNSTLNLFATNQSLELSEVDGCCQVIDVFAEAIQAEPETAAENSWGITIENETITAVSQSQ